MSESGVSTPVERVKLRRERLGEAADALEHALTRPAGVESAWRDMMRGALDEVNAALGAHVVEVESADGLYAEIMSRSPRLAHAIEVLRGEHTTLGRCVDELDALIRSPDSTVGEIREQGLVLLTELSRHRHRGADLVWDAYNLDIGESD